jgi:predicted RNA-binding Zn ribbon-like protein
MATSTLDMPLNGGHPALDLANTVDSRRGRWGPDFLRSFDDLIVLAQRVSLIDETRAADLRESSIVHPRKAKAALEGGVGLREAIYTIFLSEDTEQPYPAKALELVQEFARQARARQVLAKTDAGFVWKLPVQDLPDVVGLFAIEATDLLIDSDHRRPVRECKGDNCGWLFLDTSKSGRRVWCSDASCGIHTRVKRFRARKA